ncbi:MAG: hypothetical protein WDO71_00135 [Bacteroidota bacterium]
MKKAKNIHSIDSLEREIYRLQVEAKSIEEKLDGSIDYLQRNYSAMFVNSIFAMRKDKEEGKSGFFDSFFKNEHFNAAVNKITDRIADRAGEGIDTLIDKIFHKRK